MAGELGLLNSFRERVYEPLQAYRGNDGQPGSEISLEKFMQTRAINGQGRPCGLTNMAGNPITLEDLWQDLAENPAELTLGNLISLSGDISRLAPEIVRQFVVDGLESTATHTDLISSSQNVGQLTVTSPWIKYEDTRPQDIGEAETIPVSKISWGEKTIRLKKSAIGIEYTDEVILSCPLNLLGEYLTEVGTELGMKLFRAGVNCLINGDQAGGSDATSIIGVSVADTLDFPDYVRPWVRGSRVGVRWVNMLTSEPLANEILDMDEFKLQKGVGGQVVSVDTNRIIPANLLHRITDQLSDDQTLFFDRRAMDYLTFRGLLVENDRIIQRQIQGTYASVISGFTTLKRIRRIIVDRSLAFSENGFPVYMSPREDA